MQNAALSLYFPTCLSGVNNGKVPKASQRLGNLQQLPS